MGIMSLSEIMDRSIDILRKYVKTIIMYNIGIGIVSGLIGFIVAVIFVLIITITSAMSSGYILPGILIFFLVSIELGLYLSINIGIIKISDQEFTEERIYASEAVKVSFKNMFKVISLTFFACVGFIPAIIIFVALFFSFFKDPQYNSGGTVIFLIIYIVAGIFISLIYFSVFSLSLQAMVIENLGALKSLKRSYNLVRLNFWKIFGCIVLFTLTLYAIRSSLDTFIAFAAGILYFGAKLLNINQNYSNFTAMIVLYLKWPLTIISLIVIAPINTIMVSLLYYNQRFRLEGYDLLLNLKALQKIEERKELSEHSTNDYSN